MFSNDFTTKRIDVRLFRYPSLLSLIGLILGITGGVIASKASNPFHLNPYTKAAIVLFTVVYIVVIIILILLLLRISRVKLGERRLLFVVAICSPFVATRLIYGLISDFANNHSFNSTYGNLPIYLCMAVIPEIIVVIMCVPVGFTLPVVPKAATIEDVPLEGNTSNDSSKSTSILPEASQKQGRGRGGPITWLFRTVRDYVRRKREQKAGDTA